MNTDGNALTRIQDILDGKEWTVDMLEWIAAIVETTGRSIRPPKSSDG